MVWPRLQFSFSPTAAQFALQQSIGDGSGFSLLSLEIVGVISFQKLSGRFFQELFL